LKETKETAMTDLFGHGQMSMFGTSENLIPHPEEETGKANSERVRTKLYALLALAKSAEKMPWDARKAGMWQIVFPQMANWLSEDERDQLRFEFAQELERLKLAA
jgi:hypothetical protein